MKVLTLILLSLFISSCTTSKQAKKIVDTEAKAEAPNLSPSLQQQRAISLIKSSSDLNQEQKNKLIAVVDKYVDRAVKRRQLQGQYRAVLVKEMVTEGKSRNLRVDMAKKQLLKLDQENSKDLERFVDDFQFYAGKMAVSNQSIMLQSLDI